MHGSKGQHLPGNDKPGRPSSGSEANTSISVRYSTFCDHKRSLEGNSMLCALLYSVRNSVSAFGLSRPTISGWKFNICKSSFSPLSLLSVTDEGTPASRQANYKSSSEYLTPTLQCHWKQTFQQTIGLSPSSTVVAPKPIAGLQPCEVQIDGKG